MNELSKQLAAAVEGLTYPSESDEPWDVISWADARGDAADEIHQRTGKTSVTVQIDRWFEELADTDDADRYVLLRSKLGQLLAELTVVRSGDPPEVDVYLLGQTSDGHWAGIHTVSVET